MTTKVTLPGAVATEIQSLKEAGHTDYAIIKYSEELDGDIHDWAFDHTGAGSPDLLMNALVNGYEVEQTPEENLRDYFTGLKALASAAGKYDNAEYVGAQEGVRETIAILGITIAGINDKEAD